MDFNTKLYIRIQQDLIDLRGLYADGINIFCSSTRVPYLIQQIKQNLIASKRFGGFSKSTIEDITKEINHFETIYNS